MNKELENLEQISTPEEMSQTLQDHLKAGNKKLHQRDLSKFAKQLRIAPSKRAILQLPKDLLLKHNALIFHKGSSLSSSQRKMVQERVAYGISKGYIKPEEVAKEINIINRMLMGELTKVEKNADSSSDEQ